MLAVKTQEVRKSLLTSLQTQKGDNLVLSKQNL